ncbi:MAG TPA: hypothetical protein VLY65_01545, partial [Nitrososphaerales archaeon]|nr:hypothetical protein [Nitrososphaerales archaeon]
VFLLADVFSDVAPILYPDGYIADLDLSALFCVAFLAAFVGLLAIDFAPRRSSSATSGADDPPADLNPRRTALIIATGIGLQNLTEGLVFGANWTAGAVGVVAVVFVGFLLQNVTEGFPITSPFFGQLDKKTGVIMTLLLVGGAPAIIGGGIGYYFNSEAFDLVFDGLAIGAMTYVILPMLKNAFKDMDYAKQRMVYLGVFIGFLVGFGVNLI